MKESNTYDGTVAFINIGSPTQAKVSTTYYYLDAIGATQKIFKGDEIANYTHDYKSGRDSYYFYGDAEGSDGVRAERADVDMQMTRSAISRSATFDEADLRSETFYDLSGTKGDERALYSYNYRSDGATVKDTTI